MSNYNSQLQSNNTDLQTVLQTLQTKAAGGIVVDDVSKAIIDGTVTSINDDSIESIRSYALYSHSGLTAVSFPAATNIGGNAFYNCSKLTTISFPNVTSIGNSAFYGCSNLTTASFPVATTIGTRAFENCSNLTTTSFPNTISIGVNAFVLCPKLATASFPVATTIGGYAFYNCSSLATISFPVATSIGTYTFYNCRALTIVSFPVATTISGNAFEYCTSLATASFPAATNIGGNAFRYCYNLKSLYLTGSSLCTLSNSNAFLSTPIGGYSATAGTYGSIYVPASLLTSYQTATNWTYFSSRFVAYTGDGGGGGANLITFLIDGTEYQAEEGMTWGEWVESGYNIRNLALINIYYTSGNSVNSNDIIISDTRYDYDGVVDED